LLVSVIAVGALLAPDRIFEEKKFVIEKWQKSENFSLFGQEFSVRCIKKYSAGFNPLGFIGLSYQSVNKNSKNLK